MSQWPAGGLAQAKKKPRKSGASLGGNLPAPRRRAGCKYRSEACARQVAVAHGDAGAGHQQAVDLRHQAAEKRGGRREAERSSFGHGRSLKFGAGRRGRLRRNLRIPDATSYGFLRMAAKIILQCKIERYDFLIKVPFAVTWRTQASYRSVAFQPSLRGQGKPTAFPLAKRRGNPEVANSARLDCFVARLLAMTVEKGRASNAKRPP